MEKLQKKTVRFYLPYESSVQKQTTNNITRQQARKYLHQIM